MPAWEYREEFLDFSTITIQHANRTIPVSSLKFAYFNFPEKNTKVRAQENAWRTISPVVLERVNQLGKQGWELTSPFDPSIVEIYEGAYVPTWVLVLASVFLITIPIIFILMYTFPDDYIAYRSARLSFRRMRP